MPAISRTSWSAWVSGGDHHGADDGFIMFDPSTGGTPSPDMLDETIHLPEWLALNPSAPHNGW